MSSVRRVDAAWARQITQHLEDRGKPSRSILREVGLEPGQLAAANAMIPYAKHAALLEAAAEHLGDPCFGLHFGCSVDPLDAGLIAYVAANSPTLGDALRNVRTYLRVFTEGVDVELRIENQYAVVAFAVIDPDVGPRTQLQEFGMALLVNFCRFLTGRRLYPEWIEFSHASTGQRDEVERCFGAPAHFNRLRNALALNSSYLDLLTSAADERLLRILKDYSATILRQRPERRDLKHDVEHVVARLLSSGAVTTRSVAAELAMSERTMARRLADEGASFRQIFDEVRRGLAMRYMKEPGIRPSQVASLLGYSEPSAFNHAFRRWTGQSPKGFRGSAD